MMLPLAKSGRIWGIRIMTAIDYIPLNKIGTYELILIQISRYRNQETGKFYLTVKGQLINVKGMITIWKPLQ